MLGQFGVQPPNLIPTNNVTSRSTVVMLLASLKGWGGEPGRQITSYFAPKCTTYIDLIPPHFQYYTRYMPEKKFLRVTLKVWGAGWGRGEASTTQI